MINACQYFVKYENPVLKLSRKFKFCKNFRLYGTQLMLLCQSVDHTELQLARRHKQAPNMKIAYNADNSSKTLNWDCFDVPQISLLYKYNTLWHHR